MGNKLESEFHEAMLEIYRRAKAEADYNAARFLGMVSERGGLETARHLLHTPTVSDGYAALWERRRLDLTVDALILDSRWTLLFSEEVRLGDAHASSAERVRVNGVDHSVPILLQVGRAGQQPASQELPVVGRGLIHVAEETREVGDTEVLELLS